MKSKMKYLIVCSLLLNLGCNSELAKKGVDTVLKDSLNKLSLEKIKPQPNRDSSEKIARSLPPDTIYTHRDSVIYKENKMLVLTTCLNAEVDQDEMHYFNPVILKQEFIFLKGSKIISKCELPVKKIYQKTVKGKKIRMLENVILSIRILEGKSGALYSLYGGSGCNACAESFGLFSLTGELVYFSYGTRYENYKNIGNDSLALLKCGIPDSHFVHLSYHEVIIYPPLSPW